MITSTRGSAWHLAISAALSYTPLVWDARLGTLHQMVHQPRIFMGSRLGMLQGKGRNSLVAVRGPSGNDRFLAKSSIEASSGALFHFQG